MLTGYWAMTHDEREQHNARLLDEPRLQLLTPEKRKAYIEALYTHTLIGCGITFAMLNNPDYFRYQEHLQDVLTSFLDRQATLSRYLNNKT
ncbi:MAG: hypothetical protein NVS9B9_14990 [Ktedonobacteraceae bacterium]